MLASGNIQHYSDPKNRAQTLCGKLWPQNHPETSAHPICPECAKNGRKIIKETINRYLVRTKQPTL